MEKYKFLSLAREVISELRQEAPEMPVQMLQVFLEVCANHEQSGIDIQTKLGLSRSATSRLLKTLAHGIDAKPGFEWIESSPDPNDSRAKLYRPTARGLHLLERLAAAAG